MNTEIITYENYTFKINVDTDQIKINITDNDLIESHEGIIKENDTNIKSIKKIYSIIIRALNNDQYYTFQIDNQNSKLVCIFYYKTDMIELEEKIILNEILIMNEKQELLLLRERVKSLELMLTPIFGRHKITFEPMRFDLDSIILDFRPFNTDNKLKSGYANANEFLFINYTIHDFNKFIYVKKIIIDLILSPVYCLSNHYFPNDIGMVIPYDYFLCYLYVTKSSRNFIFDQPYLIRLPSVTELEVYVNCKEYINTYQSFPNLEKITVINNDKSLRFSIDPMVYLDMCRPTYNIKLNHLIIKNIFVDNVCEKKSRQFAKQQNIKLEIFFDYS